MMKQRMAIVAWAFVAAVIVFAVANPAGGVVYQNPLACIGLGLIGLGLTMEARKRMRTQVVPTEVSTPEHFTKS